jgi:chorismate dehydratase
VDVALISPVDALLEHEAVDVLPAVALSSWDYPLARIRLPSGLENKPRRLIADARYRQEAFVAGLVLKEHYRMMPEITDAGDDGDARMEVGSFADEGAESADLVLDLGQEWYELAGYPMIWGVFAMRKGEVTPEAIETVGTLVRTSDARRELWLQANESSPSVHAFFKDSLRVGFDDLAIASLTELRQYLYYHDVLDDLTELPVIFLEDDESDEQDDDHDTES